MKKNIWNFELVKQGDIEEFNNGKITVLSPDYNGLEKLKGFTEKIRDLDVAGKKFDFSTNINDFDLTNFKDDEDDSTENETSISFMFEYNKKRLLFLADAFPNTILNGLKETKLLESNNDIEFLKLSHHSIKGNLNNELLEAINCTNYIVSTNGLCSNKLPNKKTFARILKYNKNINLYFNYNIENIFSNNELNSNDYKINIINLYNCLHQIEVQ
ncbi:MAG: hypothetical protein HRT73_14070 [Flavobacteriales bacterium]|nr:hypothetical protein [Flavobacteriales bacterium]